MNKSYTCARTHKHTHTITLGRAQAADIFSSRYKPLANYCGVINHNKALHYDRRVTQTSKSGYGKATKNFILQTKLQVYTKTKKSFSPQRTKSKIKYKLEKDKGENFC